MSSKNISGKSDYMCVRGRYDTLAHMIKMTKGKNTKAMQNGFLKKEIKYIRPHLSWCSNIMTSRIRTTAPITDQMTDHTDIEPPITFESEKINERNTLGQ